MHCGFPPSLYRRPRGYPLTQEYAISVHLFHHNAAARPIQFETYGVWCHAVVVGVRQGKIGEGVDTHTHDLTSEIGTVENMYGILTGALITADEASWCETIKWLELTALQLSNYLHLARFGVRTRKCRAKKRCLHKHTHILWVWNATTGMPSWFPVDI